jgi:hypothetical protein
MEPPEIPQGSGIRSHLFFQEASQDGQAGAWGNSGPLGNVAGSGI